MSGDVQVQFCEQRWGRFLALTYHKMAMLPYDMNNEGVGGAIVESEGYEPSQKGILVYLYLNTFN
jgi:hypothetical protein